MSDQVDKSKLQQLLQHIRQESGCKSALASRPPCTDGTCLSSLASGAMPEELMDEGNLQQLLQQIEQDTGSKTSRIPEGGQEVTPTAGYVVHPAREHVNKHILT